MRPKNEKIPIYGSTVGVSVHTLQTLEKATTTKLPVSDNTPPTTTSSQQQPQQQHDEPIYKKVYTKLCNIYATHSFLIKALILILLAYAYPPLGAIYLAPQITATWIAVIFIFVLAGMGIKTEEFKRSFQRLPFNLFVQAYNFGVVSSIVYGFSRFMVKVNALSQSLADGMTICASLPITINMVLVLTKSAGGDEASAIFNAAIGNLIGIFLSPALILAYLGVSGSVNLSQVFFKLGMRVILPICIGQLLQHFVVPAKEFVKRYKKYFKTAQECCLLFIIYTVFCKTFLQGMEADVAQIFLMIALQFGMLCALMALAWVCLRILFRDEPKLQAMGLFGCTHKTVAMGVPLINAIYESNPSVGLYTLPLLIWHPMQLVVGSFVAPYVAAYVKRREAETEKEEDGGGALQQQEKSDDDGTTKDGPDDDEVVIQTMEQGIGCDNDVIDKKIDS
jgi:sodium/bile acid cotransporter 7